MTDQIINWNDLIEECLRATPFGCLATSGHEGVWANPVYFSWDQKGNLYFTSMLKTQHMQNIKSSPDVSFAIFKTEPDANGDVKGLQIKGSAEILSREDDIHNAFSYYFGRIYPDLKPQYGDKIDNPYAYDAEWHLTKIAPDKIFIFDTRFFGEERTATPYPNIQLSCLY